MNKINFIDEIFASENENDDFLLNVAIFLKILLTICFQRLKYGLHKKLDKQSDEKRRGKI